MGAAGEPVADGTSTSVIGVVIGRGGRRGGAWRVVVPLISALGGLLFVASAVSAGGTDLRSGSTDLESVVNDRADEVAGLRADIRDLQSQIEQMSAGLGDAELRRVRRQVAGIEAAAGLTPVAGPGLIVTLDDSPLEDPPEGIDANQLVVHQQDIQAFVNALWSGGATAISLQDQRLVSTTGVKCVGNTVVLQGVPYSPPYRIEAVGDPDALYAALDSSPSVQNYRDYVEFVDLGLLVETADDLDVPAYEGRTALEYADPM